MQFLIYKEDTGEVITNTQDPDEAQYYGGAVAINIEVLGLASLDALPTLACCCKIVGGVVMVNQAKMDAMEAQEAAAEARTVRVTELIAGSNPADAALTSSDKMLRIERLRIGLPEV